MKAVLSLFTLFLLISNSNAQNKLLFSDPLTSDKPVDGEASKRAVGGEFTPKGWRALKQNDMLVIELSDARGLEGMLEVDITELDWAKANCQPGPDTKIHFVNMFSHPKGDHHARHGGTEVDALWTLRGGCGAGGSTRYESMKVLWASKGAKETNGSDYHEVAPKPPSGWKWDKERYTFQVTWSKAAGTLVVKVNNQTFLNSTWKNQITPLKYVFLGKAADFRTLVGPYFSNLKIYTPYGGTTGPVPPDPQPQPNPSSFTLNLATGWNLVSFPFKPSRDAVSDLLGPIAGKYSAIYGYDSNTGSYNYYIPGDSSSNLSKLSDSAGYWLYMDSAASLKVEGAEATKNINLKTGWNLVGYNSTKSATVNTALGSAAAKILAVYGFDAATNRYSSYVAGSTDNDLAQLEPGKGYWVYATENVVWSIS
jgi:hypothetical protein